MGSGVWLACFCNPPDDPENELDVVEHVLPLPPTLLAALDERHSFVGSRLSRIDANHVLVRRPELDQIQPAAATYREIIPRRLARLPVVEVENDEREPIAVELADSLLDFLPRWVGNVLGLILGCARRVDDHLTECPHPQRHPCSRRIGGSGSPSAASARRMSASVDGAPKL
jgi:hypothetical protein